jgi:cyclopropane fatty-acyl-phospholipid synthase-like methyltransferase
LDFEKYDEQMRLYYDRRIDPAVDKNGREYAEETERDYVTPKPGMRELADTISAELAGRDVLELAAGMGRWTRFLVRTAHSVLATDAVERALSRLDEGTLHGQNVPPGKYRSMTLNANRPNEAPGRFTGALAVNWFQHIPIQRHADWIARLHSVLEPGAKVFIAINHLGPKSRAAMISKPNDPNLYEPRETFDGVPVDIIDNVFSKFDLVQIFGPHASSIEFTCGKSYYWIVYTLA